MKAGDCLGGFGMFRCLDASSAKLSSSILVRASWAEIRQNVEPS